MRTDLIFLALQPCSEYLTSEVPVEVMQAPHLQFKFVPHGFLQGFPLAGRLCKVFIGLRHQLDFSLQLHKITGMVKRF